MEASNVFTHTSGQDTLWPHSSSKASMLLDQDALRLDKSFDSLYTRETLMRSNKPNFIGAEKAGALRAARDNAPAFVPNVEMSPLLDLQRDAQILSWEDVDAIIADLNTTSMTLDTNLESDNLFNLSASSQPRRVSITALFDVEASFSLFDTSPLQLSPTNADTVPFVRSPTLDSPLLFSNSSNSYDSSPISPESSSEISTACASPLQVAPVPTVSTVHTTVNPAASPFAALDVPTFSLADVKMQLPQTSYTPSISIPAAVPAKQPISSSLVAAPLTPFLTVQTEESLIEASDKSASGNTRAQKRSLDEQADDEEYEEPLTEEEIEEETSDSDFELEIATPSRRKTKQASAAQRNSKRAQRKRGKHAAAALNSDEESYNDSAPKAKRARRTAAPTTQQQQQQQQQRSSKSCTESSACESTSVPTSTKRKYRKKRVCEMTPEQLKDTREKNKLMSRKTRARQKQRFVGLKTRVENLDRTNMQLREEIEEKQTLLQQLRQQVLAMPGLARMLLQARRSK